MTASSVPASVAATLYAATPAAAAPEDVHIASAADAAPPVVAAPMAATLVASPPMAAAFSVTVTM